MIQRYVSHELTHFVGRKFQSIADEHDREEAQYALLVEILKSGLLTDHPKNRKDYLNRFSMMKRFPANICDNEMIWTSVVCFCDIPNEDLHIHTQKYGRFGLAFSKTYLVRKGASPVFYVAKNSFAPYGKNLDSTVSSRENRFNALIYEYNQFHAKLLEEISKKDLSMEARHLEELLRTLDVYVFGFLKCFDDSLPDEHPDNFYMEREWRKIHPLEFTLSDVSRVLFPGSFANRFHKDMPDYFGQITFLSTGSSG